MKSKSSINNKPDQIVGLSAVQQETKPVLSNEDAQTQGFVQNNLPQIQASPFSAFRSPSQSPSGSRKRTIEEVSLTPAASPIIPRTGSLGSSTSDSDSTPEASPKTPRTSRIQYSPRVMHAKPDQNPTKDVEGYDDEIKQIQELSVKGKYFKSGSRLVPVHSNAPIPPRPSNNPFKPQEMQTEAALKGITKNIAKGLAQFVPPNLKEEEEGSDPELDFDKYDKTI